MARLRSDKANDFEADLYSSWSTSKELVCTACLNYVSLLGRHEPCPLSAVPLHDRGPLCAIWSPNRLRPLQPAGDQQVGVAYLVAHEEGLVPPVCGHPLRHLCEACLHPLPVSLADWPIRRELLQRLAV